MKLTHLNVLNRALAAFWVGCALLVLFTFGPHSPVTPNASVRAKLLTLIPQGWNFFTRDPLEMRYWLFRGDGSIEPQDAAEMRGAGLFSFTARAWRVRSVELARLISDIPQIQWADCKGTARACAKAAPKSAFAISNGMSAKSMCGPFVVVHQRLAPWPWFARSKKVALPAKVIRVDVSC